MLRFRPSPFNTASAKPEISPTFPPVTSLMRPTGRQFPAVRRQKNITLPAACDNQAKVQVRLITTNAAGPDEWIGINNVVFSVLAPTAAMATAGGRVFSPDGRALSNASITMYDSTGNSRSARSNSFGYYSFREVPVGETYIFEIRSKRYVFSQSTQVINLTEDNNSINFYADPVTSDNFKSSLRVKSDQ